LLKGLSHEIALVVEVIARRPQLDSRLGGHHTHRQTRQPDSRHDFDRGVDDLDTALRPAGGVAGGCDHRAAMELCRSVRLIQHSESRYFFAAST
jgi:hypothetical protein